MSHGLYTTFPSCAGDNLDSHDGGGPSCLVCIDHHLRSSTLNPKKVEKPQFPVPVKNDDDEERGPFGKFWGC